MYQLRIQYFLVIILGFYVFSIYTIYKSEIFDYENIMKHYGSYFVETLNHSGSQQTVYNFDVKRLAKVNNEPQNQMTREIARTPKIIEDNKTVIIVKKIVPPKVHGTHKTAKTVKEPLPDANPKDDTVKTGTHREVALKIPSHARHLLTYRVQAGDTLFTIAVRHQVALHDLIRINNLEQPDLIQPDQVLILPRRM